jgi:tryptophan-rich sensory protein
MMQFPIRRLSVLLTLFVGLTILINIGLFSFRVYDPVKYDMLPPGYVIGTIWILLIGGMAYSQFLVLQKTTNPYIQWLIPMLFVYCILYPFYTTQFKNKKVSQYANLGSIGLSLGVVIAIYPVSTLASSIIALTTVWSSYATWATFDKTLFS